MKRLSSTVVLWLLATVPAACGAAAAGEAPTPSGVVAWVDRPAPRYSPPPPTPVPYATNAPACRVDQIHATGAVVGFATGNVDERFTFTNISRASCLLTGVPAVSALAPTGRRVLLHAIRSSPHGTFFGLLVPAAMAPGGHVYLDLATEGVTCRLGGRPVYHELTFLLPDGRRLPTHTRLASFCGGWQISRIGLPQRTSATTPPKAGSVDTLHVALSLPRSARSGTTLRYLVTLSNRTDTTVRLDPCPSYTEALYLPSPPTDPHLSPALFLNCDTVHSIAPGQRVRYEMQLRLPAMPSGLAKFGWHLNMPAEAGASAMLSITR
jgi:hypothetical protein